MKDITGEEPMRGTIRLTAAQAMMRWLSVQMTEDGTRIIEGVWAIFGHGNVAGIGEGLHRIGDCLPTCRGQNEQTMAHAAIAFAKTKRRRHSRASSIGPGSTSMVTAAALAHVNRLPVLFICGDVFASRRPTRCCSRSRTRATAPSPPTTASSPSPAASTASPGPSTS